MAKRNPKQLHRVLVISFLVLFVCILFLIYSNFAPKTPPEVTFPPIPTANPSPTMKITKPSAIPTKTPSTSTKLSYLLPSGWTTVSDQSQTFQIGYDPASSDASSQEKFVSITRKNLEQSLYYSPYASTTQFSIEAYDNGSRHAFIEKHLGETISSANKSPSYKESNYIVAGKNCLIITGISISQFPTTWGMCAVNSKTAILITSFNTDLASVLKTLKFL